MKLLVATLCDSATDYQDKLCVLGAFDTLCAPQFPVVHPQCSLALRLHFEPEDIGRHEMSIRLLDQEELEIMPAFSPVMDVGFPPGNVPFVSRNLVLNLQRLRFEKPGVYSFEITLKGKMLITLPLHVTRFDDFRGTIGPAG